MATPHPKFALQSHIDTRFPGQKYRTVYIMHVDPECVPRVVEKEGKTHPEFLRYLCELELPWIKHATTGTLRIWSDSHDSLVLAENEAATRGITRLEGGGQASTG